MPPSGPPCSVPGRRTDRLRHLRDQAHPARDRLRLHRAGANRLGSPERGRACTRSSSSARSPTAPTAERFVAEGRFAWKRRDLRLEGPERSSRALAVHRPKLAEALDRVRAALGDLRGGPGDRPRVPEPGESPHRQGRDGRRPPTSRVLEVVYDWNDVGDWRGPDRTRRPRRPRQHHPGVGGAGPRPPAASSSPTTAPLIATLGVEGPGDRPVPGGHPRRGGRTSSISSSRSSRGWTRRGIGSAL